MMSDCSLSTRFIPSKSLFDVSRLIYLPVLST